jgi:hypothetical protein
MSFGPNIPWRLIAIGALTAAVLGVIGTQYVTIQHLRTEKAELQALTAQERANAERARADQEASNRVIEHRRVADQKEATDEAQRLAARARADAAATAHKHDELRGAAVATAAAACRAAGDPVTAGSGPPAGSPSMVLADVLSGVDETAGELAAALDLSYTAGQLCQRAYDSLTPNPRGDLK